MRWRRFVTSLWVSMPLACLSMGGGFVWGQQQPTPAGPASAATEASNAPQASVTDLSKRFRFVERYSDSDTKDQPEVIGQYRVITRDTVRSSTETERGAPKRQETTQETAYRERAVKVIGGDEVEAGVRAYDQFRLNPRPKSRASRLDPLKDLTVWIEMREGDDPLILSQVEGRNLHEDEYAIIRREIFVPQLTAVLPSVPSRVGDRWSVSKEGANVLAGTSALPLMGSLQQIRRAEDGEHWEAVIAVTGRSPIRPQAPSLALNARLIFRFTPPAQPAEEAEDKEKEPEQNIVDVVGSVVELRMATAASSPLPPQGRLHETITRELIVERILNDSGEPINAPAETPETTPENSWLVYEDPEAKFHFSYPQDFRPGRQPDELSVVLVRHQVGGPDALEIQRIIPTGDAQVDNLNRDPFFHLKTLKEQWDQARYRVIPGPQAWLPDADWAPSKRRVFRAEAVLMGEGSASGRTTSKEKERVHNNFYFVQFGGKENLVVTSNTVQDPATPYRNEVEQIIKTFEFGPAASPK